MKVVYVDAVNEFSELANLMQDADLLKVNRKNLVIYKKNKYEYNAYFLTKRGIFPKQGAMAPKLIHNCLYRHYTSHWGLSHQVHINQLNDFKIRRSLKKETVFNKVKADLEPIITFLKNNEKDIQLGVELELEHDDYPPRGWVAKFLTRTCNYLFDMVASDGSVRGGTEIRFNHPTLKYWDKDQVTKMMQGLVKMGFNHKMQTAGMHIHLSAPDDGNTRKAADKFYRNKSAMQKILYPISARQDLNKRGLNGVSRYGLGDDITRGYTGHKTLEIRVWEATTNPEIFMARLKFADYLMRFLISNSPISAFFDEMSVEDKLNYKVMLDDPENPHAFGIGHDEAVKLLKLEA